MLVWLNTGSQSVQVANRRWHLASSSIFLLLPAYPLFVFAFSLLLSLHILTLSSSGAVRGSREEMTGSRTMGGTVSVSCHCLESSSPPTALQGVSSAYRLVYSFILLYKHGNGNNIERKKLGLILCVSLKQPP